MEVNNNYLNNNVISDSVSTLSSSINLQALQDVSKEQLSSNSFSLEIDNITKRSNFSNTLQDTFAQLIQNQNLTKQINQQQNILDSIQNVTTQLQMSENFEAAQTTLQPQIQSSIEKYNSISANLQKDFEKYQQNTQSRNYFDGILGAKPLSPADILKAVEDQQRLLDSMQQNNTQATEQVVTRAKETIGEEVSKAVANAPFKQIDFGKNMTDFSSKTINNVVGSVVSAQANAIPAHSPKLLT